MLDNYSLKSLKQKNNAATPNEGYWHACVLLGINSVVCASTEKILYLPHRCPEEGFLLSQTLLQVVGWSTCWLIRVAFRLVVLFLFTNFRLIGWWFMVGLSRLKYCLRISFIVYILECCSTGKLIWVMDFKNSNLILRGLYEFLKIPLYFSV